MFANQIEVKYKFSLNTIFGSGQYAFFGTQPRIVDNFALIKQVMQLSSYIFELCIISLYSTQVLSPDGDFLLHSSFLSRNFS